MTRSLRAAGPLGDRGVPVRLVEYPGARHEFDRLRPVVIGQASVGLCRARLDSAGVDAAAQE